MFKILLLSPGKEMAGKFCSPWGKQVTMGAMFALFPK
jgi:hypothetical protein